jgi:hypothetical protein
MTLYFAKAVNNENAKESIMIQKKILVAKRIRKIDGSSFSFIPHRFLTGGFLSSLSPHELLLYFFLVLAGDRNGLSFYSYDRICTLLQLSLEQYIQARDGLMKKDLITFDGTLFQVLSLPMTPVLSSKNDHSHHCVRSNPPVPIGQIFTKVFKEVSGG